MLGEGGLAGPGWSGDAEQTAAACVGQALGALKELLGSHKRALSAGPGILRDGGDGAGSSDRRPCPGAPVAGIREVTHRRSLPLAPRDLRVVLSPPATRAGVTGAAHMVADALFDPVAVGSQLR
ncbi:hypothetical protein GCM10009579_70720 [Streptomyces javensis]|uniref:Uncharacterized protein n=1 Tax=Streptomyces javensis TaxID=114698 RepID=A0ABN1XGM2_9ACTN